MRAAPFKQCMLSQSGDGSNEDAALLLAIKDAEISTLRQQMAQLADDLRRNVAVSPRAMELRAAAACMQMHQGRGSHPAALASNVCALLMTGQVTEQHQSICAAARCWPPRTRMP
jgi:hypothetical protein